MKRNFVPNAVKAADEIRQEALLETIIFDVFTPVGRVDTHKYSSAGSHGIYSGDSTSRHSVDIASKA